jgi:hypothetical protein
MAKLSLDSMLSIKNTCHCLTLAECSLDAVEWMVSLYQP